MCVDLGYRDEGGLLDKGSYFLKWWKVPRCAVSIVLDERLDCTVWYYTDICYLFTWVVCHSVSKVGWACMLAACVRV